MNKLRIKFWDTSWTVKEGYSPTVIQPSVEVREQLTAASVQTKLFIRAERFNLPNSSMLTKFCNFTHLLASKH